MDLPGLPVTHCMEPVAEWRTTGGGGEVGLACPNNTCMMCTHARVNAVENLIVFKARWEGGVSGKFLKTSQLQSASEHFLSRSLFYTFWMI